MVWGMETAGGGFLEEWRGEGAGGGDVVLPLLAGLSGLHASTLLSITGCLEVTNALRGALMR